MRLPAKDSATWRALVTAVQAFLGLLVALVAVPGFNETVQLFYPAVVPVLVAAAGIASFVLNLLRPSVKNY